MRVKLYCNTIMFNTGYLVLELLLLLILFIKISIIVLLLFEKRIIKRNILTHDTIDELYEILHKYFIILMSVLLIILFNPLTEKYLILTHHIKLFLFIFGILELTSTFNLQERLKLIKKNK